MNQKLSKWLIGSILIFVLFFMPWIGNVQAAEPVVLKGVTPLAKNDDMLMGWAWLAEEIPKRSNGEIVLKWLGGLEAIPQKQQPAALKKGVVTMSYIIGAHTSKLLPEASAIELTQITPWEARKNGFYDRMVEHFKKINMMYLGATSAPFGYGLYANIKIENPRDGFKGVRMRVNPTYKALIKVLGITPVSMPSTEIYTAMERGVVDVFGTVSTSVTVRGFHEVSKYIIGPGIWPNSAEAVCVNLDTWKSLSKKHQDFLKEIVAEQERAVYPKMVKLGEDEYQRLLDKGLEHIKWSASDNEWWRETTYKARWNEVIQKAPKTGPELFELSKKK